MGQACLASSYVFAGVGGYHAYGVYRSTDGGQSFRRADFPDRGVQVWSFLHDDTDPKLMLAGGSPVSVYRCEDSGASWKRMPDPNLPLLATMPFFVSCDAMLDGQAVCTSAADPDSVIIAVRMGLFRSEDQGKTWQDIRVDRFSPFTYGRDIKVSPQDPSTLHACLSVAASSKDGALYRSQDVAKTWQRVDNRTAR